MDKASVGVNSDYQCIPFSPPFSTGSSASISDKDKDRGQTPGVSTMQHPRYVGHLEYPAGKGTTTDAVLWATVNEGVLAANIILAQSLLNISKALVGIAAVVFFCFDVYVCATRSGSDGIKSQHWDMVAFGLCIAGILLCLVDCVLTCRTPTWRFAAVGSTSSTNQPICIVVMNHQGSVYADHVTQDSAQSKNGDCAKFRLV